MPHHVKIGPYRLRERDAELRCDKLRGVGYRAVCDCGEKSRVVATHAAARAWATIHVEMMKGHGTGLRE